MSFRYQSKLFSAFLFMVILLQPGFHASKQTAGLGGDAAPGAAVNFAQSMHKAAEVQIYTVGEHVLKFGCEGSIIAAENHALCIDYVNANIVLPSPAKVESLTPMTRGEVRPFGTVSYRELWDGVTLVYHRTSTGVLESTYLVDDEANEGPEA